MTEPAAGGGGSVNQASGREPGVDVARGLGVLGVVLIHALMAREVRVPPAFAEWAGLGIMVLFTLMGVVLGVRLVGDYPAVILDWAHYSRETWRRLSRFLPGFAIAWFIALVLGAIAGTLSFGPATLIGMLPVPGPGNYFVPVLFTWVLITPFVALGSQKSLSLTVLLLGMADVMWWLTIAWRLPHLWAWSWVGGWGMFLGTGLWVGARGLKRLDWLAVGLSAGVLVAYLGTTFRDWLLFGAVSADDALNELVHHAGMSLYSAAFVIIVVALSKRVPWFGLMMWLERLGRATWWVFLVNLVWFGACSTWLRGSGTLWVAADLVVCLAGGILAAHTETRIRARATRSA
ncbi:MAG: acyltransferase [Coriobacteriia bacterium]|nr:acyltransferase [Coriobacteriia bacterium]